MITENNSINIWNQAIQAHEQWKLKLKNYVENSATPTINSDQRNTMDIDEVSNSHLCELGRWIYSEGSRHNRLPSFELLCATHEVFHRTAAEVVYYTNAGEKHRALELINPNGRYWQVSAKLVQSLNACRQELTNTMNARDLPESANQGAIYSINCNQSVKSAINMMIDDNITALAVYDDDVLIGILTERSILHNLIRLYETDLDFPISALVGTHTVFVDN
jgi:hypothetical protein